MGMPCSAFNCRASTHRIRLISRFRNEVDENPESCDSVEPVLVSDPRITFANLPGIIIFADDTLASGFYALPAQPRLARDDGDSPQINLTLYGKKKDGRFEPSGGFLALTVSLSMGREEEKAVLAQLAKYAPPAPNLLAFPWISGIVTLSLGGGVASSGETSMMGDNRCA